MPYRSAGLNYARSDESSYRKVQVWLTNSSDELLAEVAVTEGRVVQLPCQIGVVCLQRVGRRMAVRIPASGPVGPAAGIYPTRVPVLGHGNVFGETAVFADEPRNATVQAIDYVYLRVVPREFFGDDSGGGLSLGLFVRALAALRGDLQPGLAQHEAAGGVPREEVQQAGGPARSQVGVLERLLQLLGGQGDIRGGQGLGLGTHDLEGSASGCLRKHV